LGRIFRNIFYKHRTLTHSALGGFLIYKLLDLLLFRMLNPVFINPQIILLSIMVGYLAHLFADSLTEEGIPLLFPLPVTFGIPPIKPVRIKTGHWFENIIVFPATWIYVIGLIYLHQQLFLSILHG
jgi:membrane-bound metal-dependent hydrolase YbcI (DUF457 family)